MFFPLLHPVTRFRRLQLLIVLALPPLAPSLHAGAIVTKITQTEHGYQLLRDGQPYLVKGVGWPNHFPPTQLAGAKTHGANSIRTWGTDEGTRALLDEAARQGLSVSFGLWLAHERHSFDYNNVDDVARQFAEVRRIVTKFKDHPAILVWGLGNEMEEFPPAGHGAPGENAAIWSHIEALAALVKSIDPNHPVMTTIAEIGGRKVSTIQQLCPDIDLIGINAYSRIGSISERYRVAGGTKPCLITEYGPRGHWECPHTPWGAVLEGSSSDKAQEYRTGWLSVVPPEGRTNQCLGAYAFIWGHKQEATATWFGLLLDSGERLAAVDALEELWTGHPPANRVPEIRELGWTGPDQVTPGALLSVTVSTRAPEGSALRVRWIVRADALKIKIGGDHEEPTREFSDAVITASATGATLRAPAAPGAYRLFLYVYDDHDGAATANLPFLVK